MIDIPDNGSGVFRLYFLTDAGTLFSLPLSNQIFCVCSSLLSAFWLSPLSVPPLLSPGRIPAMASKGKARGELTAFPAVSADQLQHALLWILTNTTSLGRHEQTALGSNTRGSSSLLKSLQSFVDLFCKIVPAHKLWGRRGQWSNNVCLTPPRCPLPSAGSGKVAVNYSDQNLHHHFQRLQDGSEGRLEIKEQRRGTKRTREEITPIHSALLLR